MTDTVTQLYEEFMASGLVIMTKRESVAETYSTQVSETNLDIWHALPNEWYDYWLNPDSVFIQLVDTIFGEGEWHLASMYATRSMPVRGWHRSYPYECRIDPDQHILSLHVIVALDTFTKYNGVPELLLKSHTEKRWPGSGDFAQCTGPAGSMFICHGATWTRSGTPFVSDPCNALIIDIVRTSVPILPPSPEPMICDE